VIDACGGEIGGRGAGVWVAEEVEFEVRGEGVDERIGVEGSGGVVEVCCLCGRVVLEWKNGGRDELVCGVKAEEGR
jgi:hypothetical protein